jgi:hypothetical protein
MVFALCYMLLSRVSAKNMTNTLNEFSLQNLFVHVKDVKKYYNV